MKLNKELAKEARRKGICKEWHNQLKNLEDKRQMVEMYIRGIDFCLKNNYPGNDFILEHFNGIRTEYGIFVDDTINILNQNRCVALGKTTGRVETTGYGICEIFVKHHFVLTIVAKDNAFVMIDIFDNAEIEAIALNNAKVCVNQYGGNVISTTGSEPGNAIIKVIRKQSKTY
jgi:hypothetical protein